MKSIGGEISRLFVRVKWLISDIKDYIICEKLRICGQGYIEEYFSKSIFSLELTIIVFEINCAGHVL